MCCTGTGKKTEKSHVFANSIWSNGYHLWTYHLVFTFLYLKEKKNALNTTTATAPVQLLIGAFTFQWVKPYFETVRKIFCLRTFFLTMKSFMPFSV